MYDSSLRVDKKERLDFGDRWLRDGVHECGAAGAVEALQLDVTRASSILNAMRSNGVRVTWTHIFVRATAMVLQSNPDLHQIVAGNSRLNPSSVDICISVAGDSSVTPVLVIEDAANKDLLTIAAEVTRRTPEAIEESLKLLKGLRRFGWLVPFSGLRRAVIRTLLGMTWYRRKVSGTFQVTCMPNVDFFAPFLFNTVAALGVARVCDRVIALHGRPAVRRTVTLSCSFDHAVWNGGAAARFLTELRANVESGAFARERKDRTRALRVLPKLPTL